MVLCCEGDWAKAKRPFVKAVCRVMETSQEQKECREEWAETWLSIHVGTHLAAQPLPPSLGLPLDVGALMGLPALLFPLGPLDQGRKGGICPLTQRSPFSVIWLPGLYF